MLKPTNLYQEAERRLVELREMKGKIERKLSQYPSDDIYVSLKRGYTRFYLKNDSVDKKGGKYLSVKDQKTIKLLLQKRYDQKIVKLLDKEIDTLHRFVSKAEATAYIDKLQDVYSKESPKVKSCIAPIDTSSEDYARMWQEIPFVGKKMGEHVPNFITDKGEHVRSKSELAIANALYRKNIPYKYECPLQLANGKVVYPDFTVLNFSARKVIYWEHRGMMDDRLYAQASVKKIKEYVKSGFALGDTLIITEETSLAPLETKEIVSVIQTYFL